ncbi:hypothetical protein L5515_010607 [Caenorhabditis briggsae]|uniref:Uncharacterized protein n=1 Tax=Caenorhabditis briggsae TaxID=6238 RepID=A0AAE9JG66_CAEBR|nr:hypothetical protein L5515_010607 [Caenorhabditis briggsae]
MSNIQVTSTNIEKWRESAQKEGVAILNVAQGQDEMKKHLEFSYNLTGLEENEMYKISLGFHPEPNKTFRKDSKNKTYVESRNKHGPMDFTPTILDFFPNPQKGRDWMSSAICIPNIWFKRPRGNMK